MSSLADMSKDNSSTGQTFEEWLAAGSTHFERLLAAQAPEDGLAIEDRIASLRRLTANHLRLRNSQTVPLLRLPRELLHNILSLAAADRHVRDWRKLGHVCSLLMGVLPDMHRLWAGSVCTWDRRRDRLLARAGPTAPLSLIARDRDGSEDFHISHIHRARSLIASNVSLVRRFLKEDLDLRFLEELKLDVLLAEDALVLEQAWKQIPKLRTVVLINVRCLFHSTTLTNLALACTRSATIAQYSSPQLISMLRQCTKLRELALLYCLPYIADQSTSNNIIHLPSLGRLSVSDKRPYVLQLWRLLRFPSEAQVVLTLDCQASVPEYTGPACLDDAALLSSHFSGRQASGLTVRRAKKVRSLDLAITSTQSAVDPDSLVPAADARITLVIIYESLFNDATRMKGAEIHRACSALGIRDITHLVWAAGPEDDYDAILAGDQRQWAYMLKSFPKLECLDVAKMSGPMCAALCSLVPVDADPRARSELILPRLQELTMRATTVHERGDPGDAWTTAGFLDALRIRATQGSPLDCLRLGDFRRQPPARLIKIRNPQKHQEKFIKELRSKFPSVRVDVLAER